MYLLIFSSSGQSPEGTKGGNVHLAHKYRGVRVSSEDKVAGVVPMTLNAFNGGFFPWLRAWSSIQDLNEEWGKALKASLNDQLSSTMPSLLQEVSTALKISPQARNWKLQTWTYWGVFQIQTVTIFQQGDLQRSDIQNWQEFKTRAYGQISRFQS